MEKLSVSKEFVLAAYKAACETWKRKIESELPELFKAKFKDGDWVMSSPMKGFIFKIGHDEDVCKSEEPEYSLSSTNRKSDVYRLATKEEIESHLIALAEKKGFIKGVKFCTPKDKLKSTCEGTFSYNPHCDVLYGIGAAVYNSGVWAEIIAEPKTYTFTRNQCGDITEISVTACSESEASHKIKCITDFANKYTLKN